MRFFLRSFQNHLHSLYIYIVCVFFFSWMCFWMFTGTKMAQSAPFCISQKKNFVCVCVILSGHKWQQTYYSFAQCLPYICITINTKSTLSIQLISLIIIIITTLSHWSLKGVKYTKQCLLHFKLNVTEIKDLWFLELARCYLI